MEKGSHRRLRHSGACRLVALMLWGQPQCGGLRYESGDRLCCYALPAGRVGTARPPPIAKHCRIGSSEAEAQIGLAPDWVWPRVGGAWLAGVDDLAGAGAAWMLSPAADAQTTGESV